MHRDDPAHLDAELSLPALIERVLKATPLPLPLAEIQRRLPRWHEDGELSKTLRRMQGTGCVEVTMIARIFAVGPREVRAYRFIERRSGVQRRRRPSPPDADRRHA